MASRKRASTSRATRRSSSRATGERRAKPSTSARTGRAHAQKQLAEYERRRRFEVTPEPAPGTAARVEGQPSFVVHKHDATRLHYDLRLEIEGALASWAVPRGPSFDPAVKRLAVQTEDHPLEYGQFEGRIPDGEYGAGDSLIWDRGTWEPLGELDAEAQRRKGHLHFRLHGEKLVGDWHLVRSRLAPGGKQQWLLFKAKDEHADPDYDVLAERPESVVSGRRITRGPERASTLRRHHPPPEQLLERHFPLMLATLAEKPPANDEAWIYEVKYDGYRAVAALSSRRVAMWTRNRLDLTARFPAIADALGRIVVGDAVIDGEIAVLDPTGAPRFELLQQGRTDEALYFAFDLLRLDGEDLRQRPLEERRELLESVLANSPPILRLSERYDGPGDEALARAAHRGLEGLIAKRRGSTYETRRSRNWLKLKVTNTQEAAVVGFLPSKASGAQIGSLLLAVNEGGELVYAGRVGTGFSAALRAELKRTLLPDQIAKPPVKGAPRLRTATWVEPKLVAEVEFTEWTSDGKLRHPSFKGLRSDKTPKECVREAKGRSAVATKAHVRKAPLPAAPRIEVKLTNATRKVYPRDGYTKQDIADYYEAVSGPMLRALDGRPLALQHWNQGIDEPSWFHQNIGKEAQPWMTLVETPTRTSKRKVRHLVADRPETLRWLAQYSVLTVHMWSSRVGSLGMPDWVVFDLDPAEGRGIEQTIGVAHALRALFEALSIPSFPKTSGKRGLHVLVPLMPGHTHEDAVEFALRIGKAVTQVLPEATLERTKKKRRGRLYLDCLQNGYGKTIVAPYSPRAVDGAPVSAPLKWSEVTKRLNPSRYTIKTMPKRLEKVGDLFAGVLESGVRLPRLK